MGVAALRHKGARDGIHSLEDLDDVIKEIGLIDVAIDQAKNEAHLRIVEAEEEKTRRVNEYGAAREELVRLAETYVGAMRLEILKDQKSRSLNFGSFGYRKQADKLTLPKKGTPDMDSLVISIDILAKNAPFSDIEIKTERYVPAAAVKTLSDGDLAKIGLKRIPGGDVFFVQPNRAEVKELEEVSKR
jgi:hypothetical protein